MKDGADRGEDPEESGNRLRGRGSGMGRKKVWGEVGGPRERERWAAVLGTVGLVGFGRFL